MSKKSASSRKLDMNRIEQFVRFYKKLHQMPKMALTMAVFVLLAIPFSVWDVYRTDHSSTKPYDLLVVDEATTPQLTTKTLSTGKVNQPYDQDVIMTDANSAVTSLQMSFAQLPEGLSMQSCQKVNDKPASMSCTIAGTPTKAGTYTIKVTLQDEETKLTQYDLVLEITN